MSYLYVFRFELQLPQIIRMLLLLELFTPLRRGSVLLNQLRPVHVLWRLGVDERAHFCRGARVRQSLVEVPLLDELTVHY